MPIKAMTIERRMAAQRDFIAQLPRLGTGEITGAQTPAIVLRR
jgi:hypothetical protein